MFDPERVTAELHRELGSVREERPAVRHATVVTQLRLAGEVSAAGGRTVVRAEFGSPEPAVRLRRELTDLYGRVSSRADAVGVSGRPLRYLVRMTGNGVDLARATGLVDRLGRPVLGLPPAVVGGGPVVACGVWRGALLARGRVARPSGRTRIVVGCPGPAVVMALVGIARSVGVLATAHETASEHRVVVRDPDSIDTLLRATGAAGVADLIRRAGYADPPRRAPRAPSLPLETVNARRAAEAADRTVARVRWALDVLGPDAPDHLRAAGMLRVENSSLSLSRLGMLAEPPLSKDAVAGRLRRLVSFAEERSGGA